MTATRARRRSSPPTWSSNASGASSSRSAGSSAARQADEQEAVEVAGAHPQVAGPGGRARLAEIDQRGHDGGDQQPHALGGRLGVGAERGRRRGRGQQHAVAGRDRDLDRRAVAGPRLLQLVAAAPQRGEQHGAQPRGRGRRCDGAAEGDQLVRQLDQARAASNAVRAASPWTANTTRSSARVAVQVAAHLLDLDLRRLVEREAADAGAERDQREAARAERVRALQGRRGGAADDVGRRPAAERSIVAAWITHVAGMSPAVVSTASPSPIGAFAADSACTAGPPARAIAPATPPPWSSRVLAALAIASTSSAVMSVSSTSTFAMRLRYRA